MKYFIDASAGYLVFDSSKIGIIDKRFISKPIHIMKGVDDEIVIIDPIIMKLNIIIL